MLSKTLFQKLHYLVLFLFLIICIFLPLNYIKYIAWMPIVVVIHWIIFNGCILDNTHDKDPNGNVVSCIKLFNEKIGNYITEKYLQNTDRATYISFLIFTTYLTIMVYRFIYKIDILKIKKK
jgi:hypothetical protein